MIVCVDICFCAKVPFLLPAGPLLLQKSGIQENRRPRDELFQHNLLAAMIVRGFLKNL